MITSALSYVTMLVQTAYAIQRVVCEEKTPILTYVLPAFDSLFSTWRQMCNDLNLHHLSPMLNAGIQKLEEQYVTVQYLKTAIIAIGKYFI